MKDIRFDISSLTVDIKSDASEILNSYRQVNSKDHENGGVLMGELYPASNKIRITHVLVCNNQNSNRRSINLNTKCLQNKIIKIWESSNGKITYLGDWHTHPERKPSPSIVDYKTFYMNYYTSKFDQNILLYMILGNKKNTWFKSLNGLLFSEINYEI